MNTKLSIENTENTNLGTAAGPAHAAQAACPSPALPVRNPQSAIRNPRSPIRHASPPPSPRSATSQPEPRDPTDNPNRPRNNIARLPHEIHEIINQALREGEDYHIIIARVEHLVGKDHGVYPSNLSSWLRTGYREWLRQKTHLEDTIAQNDAALTQLARIKKETGADLSDLLESFLASLLQKTLRDFDPAALNALLADKPADVFRLIACLNSHIAARSKDKTAEVARARCQVQLAEKARFTREQPVPAHSLWESQLISKAYGTPFEQLMRAHNIPIGDPKKKKPRPASKTAQKDPG